MQLFAEDLKRSVSQLEKEKEALEKQKDQQMEELRKDKVTLREFLDIKEKTIDENVAKIHTLEQQMGELKLRMSSEKQKHDRQLADLRSKLSLMQAAIDTNNQRQQLQE